MFALYIFKVLYSTHSLATVYQCPPPRLGARDRPFVPNPTFSPGLPARLCELTESSILGPAQLYSPAPFPDSHPPSRLMVPTALNSPNKRWSNSHCAKSWGSHSGQNRMLSWWGRWTPRQFARIVSRLGQQETAVSGDGALGTSLWGEPFCVDGSECGQGYIPNWQPRWALDCLEGKSGLAPCHLLTSFPQVRQERDL